MRKPSYLSPSQLGLFESNIEEYYLLHLSEVRAQKPPQMNYMSLGSSFDAYVKSSMHEELFGKGADPRFEFDAIFTEQVEEHNRDWALEHGKHVFESYCKSGAYKELMELLEGSQSTPQFESKVEGEVDGIPLLGKPDLRFIHKEGAHVILDWKCNGYCSKSATSPAKNYRLCRDGFDGKSPEGKPHKNYKPTMFQGVEIGIAYLEEASTDWADQVAIYSWLLGEKPGDEKIIYCIDQICGKPNKAGGKPFLRVANHRARISKLYQHLLLERLHVMWNRIMSGHIFLELPFDENIERCKILDNEALMSFALDPTLAQMIKRTGW